MQVHWPQKTDYCSHWLYSSLIWPRVSSGALTEFLWWIKLIVKVLNMQEKQTLSCNNLETAFIELVHIPLVRNLSCTTLPLVHVKVSLEFRRNIDFPRRAVVTFSECGWQIPVPPENSSLATGLKMSGLRWCAKSRASRRFVFTSNVCWKKFNFFPAHPPSPRQGQCYSRIWGASAEKAHPSNSIRFFHSGTVSEPLGEAKWKEENA